MSRNALGGAWRMLLLGGSLMLLECLWLGAWLRWLAAMAGDLRPAGLPSLLFIGLSAHFGTRLLLALRIDLARARLLSILAALVVLLLAARWTLYPARVWPLSATGWIRDLAAQLAAAAGDFNSAGLLLASLVWLWWRGSRSGSLPITLLRARRAAGWALAALGLLSLLAATTRPVALVPWIYGALAAGLLLLALARLDEAGRAYGGSAVDFGPAWLGLVGGATAALLGAVAFLASLISEDAASDLARALEPLPTVLRRLAVMALAVVAGLAGRIAEWLAERLSGLLNIQGFLDWMAQQQPAEPTDDLADAADALVGSGAPIWLQNGLRILLLVLAIWILLRLLAGAMRRYMDAGDEREGAGEAGGGLSAGRLAADLREGLSRLAGRVGGLADRLGRRRGVRGLYVRLLTLMEARRAARRPPQTPREFQPVPEGQMPEARDEIDRLTEAYVRARYGEREPDAEELAGLREAWRRIRRSASR